MTRAMLGGHPGGRRCRRGRPDTGGALWGCPGAVLGLSQPSAHRKPHLPPSARCSRSEVLPGALTSELPRIVLPERKH